MSGYAIDPTLIDWRGKDGLRYKARVDDGVLVFKPVLRGLRDLVVFASGKSNYYISKLLNQFWNTTAFSFPSPLFFSLWTATLDKTSTGATAGECSYTGFARVSVTPNSTNFSTSATGSTITNNVAITYPSNGGSLQTATFIAVLDLVTLGAGNMLFWGSITSTAINPSDTPQIAVSGATISEA